MVSFTVHGCARVHFAAVRLRHSCNAAQELLRAYLFILLLLLRVVF
jgi:hypothetical protein